MTNSEKLHNWIRQYMPDLAREVARMSPVLFLARLNSITGAGVRCCDTIEDGSARFLAALQDLSGQP